MSLEYTAILILLIVSIICSVVSVATVRRASRVSAKQYARHTAHVKAAQHAVEADLHKGASEQFEKVVADTLQVVTKDIHDTAQKFVKRMDTHLEATLDTELKAVKAANEQIKSAALDTARNFEASTQKGQAETLSALEAHRQQAVEAIDQRVQSEVERRTVHFEAEMARIIGQYTRQAFVNVANSDDQVEYILEELEQHSRAIAEDLRHAA